MKLEESTSSIQITLQGYSHQDTMVLAQNQKEKLRNQSHSPLQEKELNI